MHRRHFFGLLAVPAFSLTDAPGTLEMVTAAHRDSQRVRALAERHPGLINASLDWGFGDWETALGAASHVGQREIAEFLLARGATPTIFSAAMLGQLDLVKAFLAASPGLQRSPGPHGLTLMSHARAGGPRAASVVSYLHELGDSDTRQPVEPLSAEDRAAILGRYVYGPNAEDHYIIDDERNQLGINRPGAPARRFLFHAGNLVFYPSGAPFARLTFQKAAGRITGFRLSGIAQPLDAKRT